MRDIPNTYLFCDLDGTLIKENSLKLLVAASKKNRVELFALLASSKFKRNVFKVRITEICEGVLLSPTLNQDVLRYLNVNRNNYTSIFLATAAEYKSANQIATKFFRFDGIIGSDLENNRKGRRKLESIKAVTKEAPFDYIGDSFSDLIIWRKANRALCVKEKKTVFLAARILRIELGVI